ncbi:MAG: hypothetical protein EXR51_11975 [Dehalococcoidia bacterium]|nr:hypothetical protein [Dehalococcoidia bacterium]
MVIGSARHLATQAPGLQAHGMVYSFAADLGHRGRAGGGEADGAAGAGTRRHARELPGPDGSGVRPGGRQSGALTYAWALMMGPMGIFGISFATALFPTLAEFAAGDATDRLRDTLALGSRLMLFLNIPAGDRLAALGQPIVALLFQMGMFQDDATRATAVAVACYSAGLFAYAGLEVITRGFYTLHDTVTPLLFAALALALNLGFGLALMDRFGHAGLALGMSLPTIAEFAGTYPVLRARVPGLQTAALLSTGARSAAAAASMGLVLLGMLSLMAEADLSPRTSIVLKVAAGVPIRAVWYVAVSLLLGGPEVRLVAGRLRGCFRRGHSPAS